MNIYKYGMHWILKKNWMKEKLENCECPEDVSLREMGQCSFSILHFEARLYDGRAEQGGI